MQFGRDHAARPVGIFRVNDSQIEGLVTAALAQFKAELTPEIASAIAQGIRTYGQRPAGERGAVTVDWGVITGTQTGYATVSIDGGGEVPISTMGDLDPSAIGQRALVLNNPPSERIVISAVGPGSGGTPTPEVPIVVAPRRALNLQPIRYRTDGQLRYGHNGGIGWQSQTNICTDEIDGTIYALYINGFNEPVMIQQTTDDDRPHFNTNLVNIFGPLINDSHNGFSIAQDAQGYIWISGNMHAAPLLIARSDAPRDITSFTQRSLPGTNTSISYPVFLRLQPDNTLVFFMRRGASGLGTDYVLRYDGTTWTDLGPVLDGDTDGVSAYMQRIVADPSGQITIMFTWRVTTNPNTNYGVYYARITGLTAGGALGMQRTDGSAITAPIRPGTEVVVTAVGPPTHYADRVVTINAPNIINNGGLDVDANGYVHSMFTVQSPVADSQQDMQNQGAWTNTTAYAVGDRVQSGGASWVCVTAHTGHVPPNASFWRMLGSDESLQLLNDHTTEWLHVYNDASGWHSQVVSNFGAFSSFSGSVPGPGYRQQVICHDNRVFFVGYWPGGGLEGAMWGHDVTPGLAYYPQPPFKLLDIPDGGFFSIDAEALRYQDTLRWLVTFSGQQYWVNPGNVRLHTGEVAEPSGEADLPHGYATPGAFAAAYALDACDGLLAIGSLDLPSINDFELGKVKFPSIKTAFAIAGTDIPITSTAPTPLGVSFPVSRHFVGIPMYVRLSVQMKVTGGSGFAACAARCNRDVAFELSSTQKLQREAASTPSGVNSPAGGSGWDQVNTMGTVFVTDGSEPTVHKTTAWCALTSLDLVGPYQQYGSPMGALGRVYLVGWWGGSSVAANIDSFVLEFGVLDL